MIGIPFKLMKCFSGSVGENSKTARIYFVINYSVIKDRLLLCGLLYTISMYCQPPLIKNNVLLTDFIRFIGITSSNGFQTSVSSSDLSHII